MKDPEASYERKQLEEQIKSQLSKIDEKINFLRIIEYAIDGIYGATLAYSAYNKFTDKDTDLGKKARDATLIYRAKISELRESCEKEKEDLIVSLRKKANGV